MLRLLATIGLAAAILLSGCVRGAAPALVRPATGTVTLGFTVQKITPGPPVARAAAATLEAKPAAPPTAELPTHTPTVTATTELPISTADATQAPDPGPQAATTPAAVGPTPDGSARSLHVPILMYHYISQPPPGADVYRRDLSVAPDRFESHLAYLRDAGYHVITLDDLLYALTGGRPLPEKPVILTFDDGYVDNYKNAFPLLQKYGMVGQFFLITDFVNENRPAYMTWPQIEEMAAAGQRFGSHSRNHPDLRGKPADYLVWQALGGKEAIQEHLGYHPRWIAYPSGAYDDRTMSVYKSADYWGGLTTNQGATQRSDGLFELSRVRVRGTYTAADLARLLELNW